MRLEGKTAIVTGAASGFGESIARLFAAEGCKVLVSDVNEAGSNDVAASINNDGGTALAKFCDVSSGENWNEAVSFSLSELGGLDIVVNNAGVPQRNQPLLDVDEETFDTIFNINVKSIYHSTLHTVPALREAGGGSIINTASTAALRPRPGLTWYNGSKGAVVTLTKSMAVELAPDNIRVNALCPVAGDTPMLGEFLGGEVTNEMYANFVSTVPMGRLSTPLDIAKAALFFASSDSEFITGVCMEVDGGRCI
ncbi:MAG: glucose 1-dehydrogenase [Hyphomicrobiales bacterium]